MNRRAFIGSLAAVAAGLALDPERALWVPGHKRIFLPTQPPSLWSSTALTRGDIFTIEGLYAVNPATQRNTGMLQNFIITADVSSGDVPTSVLCPNIHFHGHYRNVTGVLKPQARIQPVMWGA